VGDAPSADVVLAGVEDRTAMSPHWRESEMAEVATDADDSAVPIAAMGDVDASPPVSSGGASIQRSVDAT
jgi:hypothetical protein